MKLVRVKWIAGTVSYPSYHLRPGMNNSRLRMSLWQAASRRAMAHPPRKFDCIMKIKCDIRLLRSIFDLWREMLVRLATLKRNANATPTRTRQ